MPNPVRSLEGQCCKLGRSATELGARLSLARRAFRVFRYAGGHCGANRNSTREISNSGPEMCTPLFLRPKSKPAGREKPIRVAAIRVVTKYIGFSTTLGITTVQIEILGAKFQILGPRCAPHYFSGPSQTCWARKKPIRVAAIRVATKYPSFGVQTLPVVIATLEITVL